MLAGQHILISTYNYYPLNHGGTEAYVIQLLRYLTAQGAICRVIAATDVAQLAEKHPSHRIVATHTEGVAVCYDWEGIEVLGIDYRHTHITDIYTKDKAAWQTLIAEGLSACGWPPFDALYMNGLNGVSGISLIKVLKKQQPQIPIWLWEHTPFTCFKGTLMQSGQMCTTSPSASACQKCVLKDRLEGAERLWSLLPTFVKNRLPASLALLSQNMQAHFDVLAFLKAHVDKWIYFTDSMTAHLVALGIDAGQRHLQPHGIDTARFTREGRETTTQQRFLYTGRWEAIKGFFTLVEAWLALPEQPEQRILSIAGQAAMTGWSAADKKKWAALTRRSDVHLLGLLTQDQMPAVYKSHDVVLIPSQCVETGPLVFHEAIASGCQVLASDIGGCQSLHRLYPSQSRVITLFHSAAAWSQAVLDTHPTLYAPTPVQSVAAHCAALFAQ